MWKNSICSSFSRRNEPFRPSEKGHSFFFAKWSWKALGISTVESTRYWLGTPCSWKDLFLPIFEKPMAKYRSFLAIFAAMPISADGRFVTKWHGWWLKAAFCILDYHGCQNLLCILECALKMSTDHGVLLQEEEEEEGPPHLLMSSFLNANLLQHHAAEIVLI